MAERSDEEKQKIARAITEALATPDEIKDDWGRLIVDTMLPAAWRISSGRAETGAIATSDSSGNSSLDSR